MPAPADATGFTDIRGGAAAILDLMTPPKEPEAPAAPDTPPAPEAATDTPAETPDAPATPDTPTAEAAPEGDSDAEAPAPTTAPDDAMVTITVDGKPETVPVKELRSGYLRTKDYTQKTQAVAEQRRALEGERATVQQLAARYSQGLDQMMAALSAQAPQQPDPALYASNPTEFAYQSEMFRRHQEQLSRIAAEKQRLAAAQAAEMQQARHAHLTSEREKLLAKVPEWSDTTMASKEQAAIAQLAQETYGFTPDELADATDHRAIHVLRDAMRYHQLMKDTTPLVAQATKPKTPTLAPAPATPTGSADKGKSARARLAQTGKLGDAAAAILASGLVA